MTIEDKLILQDVIDRILYCPEYKDKLKEFNTTYVVDTKILIQEENGIYKQNKTENNDSNK